MDDSEKEKWLMKIPVLGYILRKIKKNQEVIERTLKAGKPTKGKIRKSSFLWLFKITSGKTFQLLKFKRIRKKWK